MAFYDWRVCIETTEEEEEYAKKATLSTDWLKSIKTEDEETPAIAASFRLKGPPAWINLTAFQADFQSEFKLTFACCIIYV